ncbi:MAG: ribonuclease HII [Pseudomonadota bacterium]
MPDYSLETGLGAAEGRIVIGLDEAGRGPWAGPVVAGAAWLDPDKLTPELLSSLDDSKKLSRAARETVLTALEAAPRAAVRLAVGQASVGEIDRLNILQASLLAMARAAEALGLAADAALVDGNREPALTCPATCVVKGDGRSWSIAAASILAKVTRDRQMATLARRYPGYGWERNQGYGTAEHQAALARLGVTAEHRRSFRPIREALTLTS